MPTKSTLTGSYSRVFATIPSKNGPYPSHGVMGQHRSDISVPVIDKQLGNSTANVQDMVELERQAFRVQHVTCNMETVL
ncbi:hypothetical protein Q3G72_025175 [Acer saccharum]|nr:hypothetical protein Q3G72_025175 [Acer saccharum]